jgi:hypothetical protein
LTEDAEVVFVGTNWRIPDKCLWIVEKKSFRQNSTVVFPFPELSSSVCHIFVGTSDSHLCFIHLTPLTSLFRESAGELNKIIANLAAIIGADKHWLFQVYFFADNNEEIKFRNIISEVLGKENVTFTAMKPKGYKHGNINLLYQMNGLFYSTQDAHLLLACQDASTEGFYNRIPIDAYG